MRESIQDEGGPQWKVQFTLEAVLIKYLRTSDPLFKVPALMPRSGRPDGHSSAQIQSKDDENHPNYTQTTSQLSRKLSPNYPKTTFKLPPKLCPHTVAFQDFTLSHRHPRTLSMTPPYPTLKRRGFGGGQSERTFLSSGHGWFLEC